MMSKNQQDLRPTWCLIAGDNHGEFDHLVDAAKRYRPQYILSVGDIEPRRALADEISPIEALGCRFLFAHGNHDTDQAETWARMETASDRNMHGRVVQVGHLKVAFLGGVFRKEIWYPPQEYSDDGEIYASAKFESYDEYVEHLKRKTPPRIWNTDPKVNGKIRKHKTTIFPAAYHSLMKQRCDVLITHEAGSWAHIHGFQAVDDLAGFMRAKAHFFGHHHCRRFRQSDQGVISVGIGLRGITAIDGTVIREGDLDKQRQDPLWP